MDQRCSLLIRQSVSYISDPSNKLFIYYEEAKTFRMFLAQRKLKDSQK